MAKLVQATKSDVDLILGYMQDFYAIDDYPFDAEKSRANLKEFIADEALGVLYLIHEASQPVGYLTLTFGYSFEYGGRDAFIDELYLTEEARGKGIGSAVMMLLEEQAKVHKVKAIHLEVEPHNVKGNRIYQKAGYVSNDRKLMTKRIA